jgi:hypothetical protein
MEVVVGGWRRLHEEELHKVYASPNVIRLIKSWRMRSAGHVVRIGNSEMHKKNLAGKYEGMKPHRRPGNRWKDNIRMDFREKRLEAVDWIYLV